MVPFCQSEKQKGPLFQGKTRLEARIFKIYQLLGVPKLKKQQTPFEDIWPNGIIFHQPRFPWNSRGPISLTKPTIFCWKSVVFSVAISWPTNISPVSLEVQSTKQRMLRIIYVKDFLLSFWQSLVSLDFLSIKKNRWIFQAKVGFVFFRGISL